ncbi:MAG: hypothetical protein AAGI52_02475 [Bacteroidota bacterium]
MRTLFLLFSVTALSACSVPAVVHAPIPPPAADEQVGVSVSGALGSGPFSHSAGYGALIVRPIENLGFYVSGVQTASDSSDGSPAFYSRQRLTEVGVTGALPASERTRVTGSLGYQWGNVRSGGTIDEWCFFSDPCTDTDFLVDVDARTVTSSVGLVAKASSAVQLGFRSYLSFSQFENATYAVRGDDIPTPDAFDAVFGGFGPTLLIRTGPASFHLHPVFGVDLGGLPTAADENGAPNRLFTADPLTVQAGVSLDLAQVWTSAASRSTDYD